MIATDTLDPRDPWSKIRRMEAARMLEALGVKVDGPNGLPPVLVMVNMLKAKGILPPRINGRGIGKDMNARDWDTSPVSHVQNGNTAAPAKQPAPVVTVDADELLAQEWAGQPPPFKQVGVDFETMDFNTLRRTARAAGIKISRRYGKADYINLLRAKNGKQDVA